MLHCLHRTLAIELLEILEMYMSRHANLPSSDQSSKSVQACQSRVALLVRNRMYAVPYLGAMLAKLPGAHLTVSSHLSLPSFTRLVGVRSCKEVQSTVPSHLCLKLLLKLRRAATNDLSLPD